MKKIYFPNLNGLRFFAALSVMLYHYFGIDIINGHFGVILFFVLSGFLITYLLLEEKEGGHLISIKKFYARRILRIWPLYFFILVLSSAIIYFKTGFTENYYESLPYYLLFVPNLAFAMGISFNYASVLWSVGSEEQFYLLWPLIINKTKRANLKFIFLLIILFWTFAPHLIDFINYNYLSHNQSIIVFSEFIGRMGFGAMATGASLALITKYHPKKLRFAFYPAVQISIFIFTITIWLGNVLPHTAIVDELYSILFAIIISNFALNPKVIFSLENKLFNYLGKISFGLYVYHLVAFEITKSLLSNDYFSERLIFIFSLLFTIIISTISYEYIEKPFLQYKSNKFTVIKSGNDIGIATKS